MNDPTRADLGDWALTVLAGIFIGVLSGLGTAMGWFKGSKARIYERITGVETTMKNYEAMRATQATQLAVLETCQENINNRLDEIKDQIELTARQGAESVNDKFKDLLDEIKKRH